MAESIVRAEILLPGVNYKVRETYEEAVAKLKAGIMAFNQHCSDAAAALGAYQEFTGCNGVPVLIFTPEIRAINGVQ